MKMELYQCAAVIKDEESGEKVWQNVYFDTLIEAKKFASSHNRKTITRLVGDMKRTEQYEWGSRKTERIQIVEEWDWYPIEEKEGEE